MHTFDSLARSLVQPAQAAQRQQRSGRSGSALSWAVSICCALMPFGVMVQAYLLTA